MQYGHASSVGGSLAAFTSWYEAVLSIKMVLTRLVDQNLAHIVFDCTVSAHKEVTPFKMGALIQIFVLFYFTFTEKALPLYDCFSFKQFVIILAVALIIGFDRIFLSFFLSPGKFWVVLLELRPYDLNCDHFWVLRIQSQRVEHGLNVAGLVERCNCVRLDVVVGPDALKIVQVTDWVEGVRQTWRHFTFKTFSRKALH